jgi:hypothetical protein
VILVPGWALLSVRRAWREVPPLQAWALAASLGVAFYPVLFFVLRVVSPGASLGRGGLAGLLVVLAVLAAASLGRDLPAIFRFARLEAIAIAVVAVTLGTRAWVAHLEPFPAWSDSLHHVLITELTARQGRLPATLEPYFRIPLAGYHLGLYALTAPVQLLADVPAHTATLWLSQVLSGLAGLGVYLVLDRRVSRVAAVIGAICAGLVSHQPAFYVNWGRYTQLAAQTILLPAWVVAWDAMREAVARGGVRGAGASPATKALHACLLIAGVFLLHFRVAVFLAPLLGLTLVAELWRVRAAPRERRALLALAALLVLGALVLAAPGVVRAVADYFAGHWAAASFRGSFTSSPDDRLAGDPEYYVFSGQSIGYLFGGPGAIAAVVALAAVALVRRSAVAWLTALWAASLIALGEAHRLHLPVLNLTNAGAVWIMLYLPASLLVATGVHELLAWLRAGPGGQSAALLLFFVLGGLGARDRVTQLEPERFFVTPADLRAMEWIGANTPPKAVFAVRSTFWLPGFVHGTDAGQWIPYLAGRRTTVGPMLVPLSPRQANWTREMSKRAQTPDDEAALRFLFARGVRYFYFGARGNPDDAARLAASPYAILRYADGGVFVYEIDPHRLRSPG